MFFFSAPRSNGKVGVVQALISGDITTLALGKMAELAVCGSAASHGQHSIPSQEQLDEMELLQAMSNADEFNWTQDPETGHYSMHALNEHGYGGYTDWQNSMTSGCVLLLLQVGCLEP